MRPLNLRSILRNSVLALGLAAVVGGIAAVPASAEEWHRYGNYGRYDHDDGWRAREYRAHEWREHEWREHEWREHRYVRDYDGPRVVYGAPYYYGPPVISFGLNLR
jgi:hypothetical protein